MKLFTTKELREAVKYASDGGQALHVHPFTRGGHKTFARYTKAAHLFDQDIDRLSRTALALGVRVIKVERKGQRMQHIDLCGKPLAKAEAYCDRNVW